ncbi:MAG: hypothetical protein ABII21_02345 [bacterium]
MAQKITHWLLITLVISLGFGQLLRFDLFSIPIYLHDIIVVCFLVLQLPRTVLKRNSWLQAKKGSTAVERTVLYGTTGISVFLLGLSLGWLRALTLYPLSALLTPSLYTFRLLAYLALYFVIKQSKILIPKSYFLISGFLTLTIGLTQYFLLPDMRVFKYLGWDDHLSRLALPHFDPTFTAVMLVLFALYSLRQKLFIPAVLSALAIFLTYSRSVWLSIVFTAIFFIKNKLVLLLVIASMLFAIFLLPKRFGEGTNLLRTYSISSRVQSDLYYIQKYQWDLIIGRGFNTLTLDMETSDRAIHATGPNNSYLYLLLTAGVLGLIGWGILMFSLYRRSPYKPMLAFLFITSLFNNVMFYPFALLWILLIESTAPSAT